MTGERRGLRGARGEEGENDVRGMRRKERGMGQREESEERRRDGGYLDCIARKTVAGESSRSRHIPEEMMAVKVSF
jgi:hypothetical protein